MAEDQYMISAEQMQAMANIAIGRPRDLMLSYECRRFLALDRWKKSNQALRIHATPDTGVMPGTVAHNRHEVEDSIFRSTRRTARLINPLSAIDPVYSNPEVLRVLSIGPRTEMEIFHLIGIGFEPKNITAIDLISPSPLIDVGDMHELPYPDRSFDVVLSGWAIAYSNRPQRVMDEMMRVCKSGGLLAVGCTYNPVADPSRIGVPVNVTDTDGNNFGRAADLLALMGGRVDRLCFQHEPVDARHSGVVMVIATIRH